MDNLITCAHVGAASQKTSQFKVPQPLFSWKDVPTVNCFLSWKAGWVRMGDKARSKKDYTSLNRAELVFQICLKN